MSQQASPSGLRARLQGPAGPQLQQHLASNLFLIILLLVLTNSVAPSVTALASRAGLLPLPCPSSGHSLTSVSVGEKKDVSPSEHSRQADSSGAFGRWQTLPTGRDTDGRGEKRYIPPIKRAWPVNSAKVEDVGQSDVDFGDYDSIPNAGDGAVRVSNGYASLPWPSKRFTPVLDDYGWPGGRFG
ncbi:unnamed protein product [Protopolystoma xenopodis]|uniref:Uncharacterized protein n=1 Tax=Protopolystoma xenopodis TaxID=117903 RepID=A0A448WWF6_9PLAT|nr:unnamed protein product [Protopolystoma xenopodis]